MTFNINEFRSALRYGGARTSLFQVQLFDPSGEIGDGLNNIVDFDHSKFMIKAAQLPGSNVGVIPISYFGRQIKLASNRVFDPWLIQVINDEDFRVRNMLEQWSNAINALEANQLLTGTAAPNAYKAGAIVHQLSKSGDTVRSYEFDGFWVSDLSPIDVNWDAELVQEFQATFQYDYYRVIQGTAAGVDTSPGITGQAENPNITAV